MEFDDSWVRASDMKLHKDKDKLAQAVGTTAQSAVATEAITINETEPVEMPTPKKRRPSRKKGAPVLKVNGLTVSFPKSGTIFQDLDLTVYEGEKVCIVGSNGAGKSTLAKACLGIVPAQAGTVELFGEEYPAKTGPTKEQLSKIGMVHQKHNLIARASALGNALHGALSFHPFKPALWWQGFAPSELREEAMYYLERVGLGKKAANNAGDLSGGQSQRVAIARALMQKPKLIIADEPVASLDPVSGQQVMEVFADLVDEEGSSLIFISHHLSHAVEFADRVVGIKNKQIGFDVRSDETSIEELESIYGN